MKIAHFITTAGLYGAERWVLSFLTHAIKHDSHKFLLICTSSDNQELVELARERQIKCYILPTKHNFDLTSAIRQLRQLIKKEDVDILHSHGYKSDIIGYLASRSTGSKTLSTPHGWDLQSGIKVRCYNWLDRQVLRFFDRVVPLSKPLAKTLSMIPGHNLSVINNHIDLEELPNPDSGDPFLISYVGRLTRLKRVEDIIRALSDCDSRVRLQIIGEGPERQTLELLTQKLGLQQRVSFLGYRADRLALLNQSRIFVLPSSSEGTSRSMMEAMALGKIVIGSNIAGNRVLVQAGKTGYLFPVGDVSALHAQLQNTLKSPQLNALVSRNARDLIYQAFSAQSVVLQYLEVYTVLSRQKKQPRKEEISIAKYTNTENDSHDG